MSQITTHVLDTTRGKPGAEIPITLYQQTNDGWQQLASGVTNDDGRIAGLLPQDRTLDTQAYFDRMAEKGFYPYVDIVFELDAGGEHYHIPLLLSAYGYSTYRGS